MPKCFVRITSVPEGEAPESIRRAWLGLVLPVWTTTDGRDGIIQTGVISGKSVPPLKGYVVYSSDAIEILGRTNREAQSWWETHALQSGSFTFAEEWCEIVPD